MFSFHSHEGVHFFQCFNNETTTYETLQNDYYNKPTFNYSEITDANDNFAIRTVIEI